MAYPDPEQQTSTIKPPARNPAASVPGLAPLPAITVPAGGDGVNPITKIVANLSPARDQYGNDMTRTNQMKAAMGEAPVGQATAVTPAPAAPPAVVRDQYGNDMTATNAMKKQLGEAPIGSPAASVPGVPARDAVQTRGYVATQAGQMNPAMERVINAQPNPLLASVLNGKQTAVPQITGTAPVQNVGPASPGQSAGPQANPIALAAQVTAPALLAAKVANPPAGPQSLPSATPIDQQAQTPGAPNASPQNQDANPLTSINMQANNDSLARANTTRQQMIDGDGQGPKVTMIENSGLKETQELMDKWGRQDMQREMMQEMARNPKAAGALASLAASGSQAETQRQGQALGAEAAQRKNETEQRGQDISAETEWRGQDIRAQTEANRLAGNPLDNQLKQVQIQTGQTALERAKANEAQIAAINAEKDPEKRKVMVENHLASLGKEPRDSYIAMPNIKQYNEVGQVIGEAPGGALNKYSGEVKGVNPLVQGNPRNAPAPKWTAEDYELTAKKYGITVDQVKSMLAQQQGAK